MTNNEWYFRGEFPPVGEECQALTEAGWSAVTVVGHDNGACIFRVEGNGWHDLYRWGDDPRSFRPKLSNDPNIRAVEEILSNYVNTPSLMQIMSLISGYIKTK